MSDAARTGSLPTDGPAYAPRVETPSARDAGATDAALASACCLLIFCAIFLQKIAVPGTGGQIPVTSVLLPAVGFLLFYRGALAISGKAATWFVAFLFCAMISNSISLLSLNYVAFSIPSIILIALVQLPLILRSSTPSRSYFKVQEFYLRSMLLIAAIAPVQFLSQYIIGPKLPFLIDFYTPKIMLISGFNILNALGYGSPIFKSNGFFLAEPAITSQFLALAILMELAGKQRLHFILMYGAGIAATISGTGIFALLILAPFYVPALGVRKLFAWSVPLLILGVFALAFVNPDALLSRLDEFGRADTSGNARFVSIFYVLEAYIFNSPIHILFGRGSGTVYEYRDVLGFEMFDPSWGKLVYEYGVVGTFAYVMFLAKAVHRSPATPPLLLMLFVLGGYLAFSPMLALIATLACWHGRAADPASARPAPG